MFFRQATCVATICVMIWREGIKLSFNSVDNVYSFNLWRVALIICREGVSWASSRVRRSENGDKLFLLVGTCGAYLLVTMLPLMMIMMMMVVMIMKLDNIDIVGDDKMSDMQCYVKHQLMREWWFYLLLKPYFKMGSLKWKADVRFVLMDIDFYQRRSCSGHISAQEEG